MKQFPFVKYAAIALVVQGVLELLCVTVPRCSILSICFVLHGELHKLTEVTRLPTIYKML